MELNEAIRTRRSIRNFIDKPVEEEILLKVVEAGMFAPSAGNQQPWHFIVVTERQLLDQVTNFHPFSKMITAAPAAILVCGDPYGKKWPTFWAQDCSAATQNMLLAARGLGLGTVWAGIYPEEDRIKGARALFGIPEDVVPFSIVPIGWPAVDFKSADRFKPHLVHREKW
jgi:nitroreductase